MLNYDSSDITDNRLENLRTKIQEKASDAFVTRSIFSKKLHLFLKDKTAFYVDDKEAFIDQEIGTVDWDALKW